MRESVILHLVYVPLKNYHFQGGSKMTTKKVIFGVLLILTVFVILVSCATGKKIITVDDAMKRFEGVYVNTEYSGQEMTQPQKFVITSDGRIEDWSLATNEYPSFKGKYTIAESWTDSKGNMYCKVDLNYGSGKTQELWKLDKSGNTLEVNYKFGGGGEYPTKIDPNPDPSAFPSLYYCIWYP
jgi:hypothetical protein